MSEASHRGTSGSALGRALGRHPRAAAAALCVAALAVTAGILEIGLRIRAALSPSPFARTLLVDPELGWVLNPARPTIHKSNRCGEAVSLAPPTSRYLVRAAPEETSTRVLFLGDSYTQAHEVSTGEAYYDAFERSLAGEGIEVAVFAAAVGGFGNLQEFLLLRKVFPVVRPQLIVWQLTDNDVANNVIELGATEPWSMKEARPYLDPDSGEIVVRDPRPFLLRGRLPGGIIRRLNILAWRFGVDLDAYTQGWLTPAAGQRPALEARGEAVLAFVVRQAVREFPDVQIVGFDVGQKRDSTYERILRSNGADYVAGLHTELSQRPGRLDCLPFDPHWNHRGNREAGELLARRLAARLRGLAMALPDEA